MNDTQGAVGNVKPEEKVAQDAAKAASIYAWEYFKYHAGQRQAVFRFFLALVGAATIALAYSQRAPTATPNSPEAYHEVAHYIGALLVVSSFLFWCLDKRSRHLIKLSETALKTREKRLSELLQDRTICLMDLGDERVLKYPMSEFETFRQIYGCIFLLIGSVGAFMINQRLGIASFFIFLIWYISNVRKRVKRGRIRWPWSGKAA